MPDGRALPTVTLRVELDEAAVYRYYQGYLRDIAHHREHGDVPVGDDEPIPFDRYAQNVLDGIIEDLAEDTIGYTLVRLP